MKKICRYIVLSAFILLLTGCKSEPEQFARIYDVLLQNHIVTFSVETDIPDNYVVSDIYVTLEDEDGNIYSVITTLDGLVLGTNTQLYFEGLEGNTTYFIGVYASFTDEEGNVDEDVILSAKEIHTTEYSYEPSAYVENVVTDGYELHFDATFESNEYLDISELYVVIEDDSNIYEIYSLMDGLEFDIKNSIIYEGLIEGTTYISLYMNYESPLGYYEDELVYQIDIDVNLIDFFPLIEFENAELIKDTFSFDLGIYDSIWAEVHEAELVITKTQTQEIIEVVNIDLNNPNNITLSCFESLQYYDIILNIHYEDPLYEYVDYEMMLIPQYMLVYYDVPTVDLFNIDILGDADGYSFNFLIPSEEIPNTTYYITVEHTDGEIDTYENISFDEIHEISRYRNHYSIDLDKFYVEVHEVFEMEEYYHDIVVYTYTILEDDQNYPSYMYLHHKTENSIHFTTTFNNDETFLKFSNITIHVLDENNNLVTRISENESNTSFSRGDSLFDVYSLSENTEYSVYVYADYEYDGIKYYGVELGSIIVTTNPAN